MIIILKLSELISMIPFAEQMDNAKAFILCDTTQMPVQLYMELNNHHIHSEFVFADTNSQFLQGILIGSKAAKDAENEDIYIITDDADSKTIGLPDNFHITSVDKFSKVTKKKVIKSATVKKEQAEKPEPHVSPAKSSKQEKDNVKANKASDNAEFMNEPVEEKAADSKKESAKKVSKSKKKAPSYGFDPLASAISDGAMKATAPQTFKKILNDAKIDEYIKKGKLKVDDTYDKIYYAVYESDTDVVLDMRMRFNLPENPTFANKLSEEIKPIYTKLREAL